MKCANILFNELDVNLKIIIREREEEEENGGEKSR